MPTRTARLRPLRPDGPRTEPWHVAVVAALALAATGPGQTIGVSVFVDPLSEALDLTRSQVSGAYMVGTLAGALAMPFAGRAIDRLGVRLVMAVVGAAFGLAAMAVSGVTGLVTLGLAFVGIRALGQGSLSLTATTTVGVAFRRRRGLAVGLATAVGTALMGLVPVALNAVIDAVGWRLAWVVAGAAVALLVAPLGWFGLRAVAGRHGAPEGAGACGDHDAAGADGAAEAAGAGEEVDARGGSAPASATRGQALRTPLLWAITGATASTGLIGTGMTFHQISLLGERGFTRAEAAATFVPQSVATITSMLLAGWLADRWPPRAIIPLAMALQATGMAMVVADALAPGWLAVGYAVMLGGSGGLARAYEAAAVPRFYGTAHLGAIRGLIMAVNVAGTSLGPIALALGFSATDSYGAGLAGLLALPLAVAVLGLVAPTPRPPEERAPGRVAGA